MKSFIIIGAGISGLTAAVTLKKHGCSVTVLESTEEPGGVAKTLVKDGFRCELGPNTLMVSQPETVTFLKENNLWESAIEAAPFAKNRFVIKNQKLISIPLSPYTFLTTRLLSFQSKLKVIHGLFSSKQITPEEIVADFFDQTFGKEVLQEMVDPFISGIWAGNPAQLNLKHAFPKLFFLKQKHGSLIKAFLNRKKNDVRRRLISWPEGLGYLSQKLAKTLSNELHFNTEVQAIHRENNQFYVRTQTQIFKSDYLILATHTSSTAQLLTPLFAEAISLSKISRASLNVVHLGFDRSAIQHPLNGFGVLISRTRKIRTLGALFSSTLFPQRAPNNQILLTAFVGGIQDPDAINFSDEALVKGVLNDLKPYLDINHPPIFQNIVRWPNAIPQYDSHHHHVLELCQKIENEIPGLFLLGNYRGGISLENVLINAQQLANRLV